MTVENSHKEAQEAQGENKDHVFAVCDVIRSASLSLHSHLRHGHLEKVYENGLVNRLKKLGLKVERQMPLTVHDEDNEVIGEFVADLIV